MSNENYHVSVSKETIEKIEFFASMIEDNRLFTDNRMIDCCEVNKVQIEFKSSSGFISHNKGGIDLWFYAGNGIGSGVFLTKKQAKFVEWLQNECLSDFLSDNDLPADYDIFENQDCELWAKFEQYESDYYSDGSDLMIVQSRVFVTDNDIVIIDLSVCYRGAAYYRESCFEQIGCLELSFTKFERISVGFIEKYFYRAMNRV